MLNKILGIYDFVLNFVRQFTEKMDLDVWFSYCYCNFHCTNYNWQENFIKKIILIVQNTISLIWFSIVYSNFLSHWLNSLNKVSKSNLDMVIWWYSWAKNACVQSHFENSSFSFLFQFCWYEEQIDIHPLPTFSK